jgi:hypothetical protein
MDIDDLKMQNKVLASTRLLLGAFLTFCGHSDAESEISQLFHHTPELGSSVARVYVALVND